MRSMPDRNECYACGSSNSRCQRISPALFRIQSLASATRVARLAIRLGSMPSSAACRSRLWRNCSHRCFSPTVNCRPEARQFQRPLRRRERLLAAALRKPPRQQGLDRAGMHSGSRQGDQRFVFEDEIRRTVGSHRFLVAPAPKFAQDSQSASIQFGGAFKPPDLVQVG